MDSRLRPGFDALAAASNVLKLAIDEHFIAEDDLEHLTKVVDPATGARSVSSLGLTLLGERHCSLHRMQPPEAWHEGDELLYCRVWPCRHAGIAFTLKQLGIYLQNLSSGLPDLADGVDLLTSAIQNIPPSVLGRARSIATAYAKMETWRDEQYPNAQRVIDVPPPWEPLVGVLEAFNTLPDIAKRIRMELTSPQLKQDWSRRGGRREEALLAAVWQHLHVGGFSPREVVRLIPNPKSGDEAAQIRCFYKHVAGRDRRSERPWITAIPPLPPGGGGRSRQRSVETTRG